MEAFETLSPSEPNDEGSISLSPSMNRQRIQHTAIRTAQGKKPTDPAAVKHNQHQAALFCNFQTEGKGYQAGPNPTNSNSLPRTPLLWMSYSNHASWNRCVPARILYSNPTLLSDGISLERKYAHSLRVVRHGDESSNPSYSGNWMQIRRNARWERRAKASANSFHVNFEFPSWYPHSSTSRTLRFGQYVAME